VCYPLEGSFNNSLLILLSFTLLIINDSSNNIVNKIDVLGGHIHFNLRSNTSTRSMIWSELERTDAQGNHTSICIGSAYDA
jgi:hypothetical protein